ncbi:MAG: response regulator [Alphaproteobacteria bacterium]|nr:MAG: response regulator [Alphaproteobacteria bacterium]
MPPISTELVERDVDPDFDPDLEASPHGVDQIDRSMAEEEPTAQDIELGRMARLMRPLLDDGGPAASQIVMIILGSVGVVLLAALAARAPGILGVAGMVLLTGLIIVPFLLLLALARGLLPSAQIQVAQADSPVATARRLAFDLLDRSQVPCLLTGREGNGLYANDAFRSYFKVKGKEAPGLESLFAQDEGMQAALYRLSRAASQGERASEQVLVQGASLSALRDRADGSRWLEIEIRPVEAEVEHFLWEIYDVTGDKTQEALQEVPLDERLVALNALPIGVFAVDSEGQVRFANRTFREWLTLSEDAALDLAGLVSDPVTADRLKSGADLTETEIDEGWIVAFDLSDEEVLDLRLLPATDRLLPEDIEGAHAYLVTLPRELGVGAMLATSQSAWDGETQPMLSDLVNDAPIGVVTVSSEGVVLSSNPAFREMAAAPALPGDPLQASLAEGDRARVAELLASALDAGVRPKPLDISLAGDKGRSCQLFINRIEDPSLFGSAQAAAILYFIDTTEQRALELQFTQSQKMQAVGQLAGGVAHDFNNVLTAIIGYCDLLLAQHKVGDPSFADLNQIKQNANRAANLVRQLLAFSRRQTLVPRVLQLSNAIAETEMLLKRLLGEKIEFVQKQQRDLGLVKVDQGQLEQVVVNLAVNARDAMGDGGTLTISTYNVSPDDVKALGHSMMAPADFVCLEVADTGCGIAKENLANIFEPFFTTKGVGQGTGLGLSTVYGIIKQTGGFIFPESEEGVGTTFKIYLPRHPDEELPTDASAGKSEPKDLSGEGTVLLVEDEDAVRSFAARALTTRGYRVLEASNGEMGLEIVEEEDGNIDIMVSDVVMPTMDGPTMARHVKEKYPDIKVIFISGYTEDAFEDDLDRPEDFTFLPKPFSLKELASKVKEVLER